MISRSFERPDRTASRASDARNRYKIRYTTNQHRPASRQVNDHGRVSGTHRHRSPHTNGVVERWIESLKYERLYREDIASGVELADSVADFINEYNTVRPHQALDHQRPLDAYLHDRTLKPNPPRKEQDS